MTYKQTVLDIINRSSDSDRDILSIDKRNLLYDNELNHVDINRIMESQHILHIPSIYRSYLISFGRDSTNKIFDGGHSDYESLLKMKNVMFNRVNNYPSQISFDPRIFVFLAYDWEQYFFVHTEGEHDDPPVFYFIDGATDAICVSDSMSKWFINQVFHHNGPLGWLYENIVNKNQKNNKTIPF